MTCDSNISIFEKFEDNDPSKYITPFLEQFHIYYARQVDYRKIPKKLKSDETLALAENPHPVLILEILPEYNLMIGCFGTTVDVKEEDFTWAINDLVLNPNKENGLENTTLFRMHVQNINLLPYSSDFFEKRRGKKKISSYKMGELGEEKKEDFRKMYDKCPQIKNIMNALKREGVKVLKKEVHNDLEYYLPFTDPPRKEKEKLKVSVKKKKKKKEKKINKE